MPHITQLVNAAIRPTSQADTRTQSGHSLHPTVERFDWQFVCYTPQHHAALAAAKRFASAALNREEPRWLTLLGPSGIGKTHLLRQTLKLCHRLVNVDGWPRELSTARVIPSRDLDVYSSARDYAQNFDVVFVEDIMAGDKGAGAVIRDRIADLLQQRSRRFTLIDGNFSGLGDVADYFDGRISSRMMRDSSEFIQFDPATSDFNEI